MRTKVLFAALLLSATTAFAQQEKLGSGIDKTNMDLTIKPGNDFYRYAAGNWMKNHPLDAEHTDNGAFTDLFEQNQKRIQDIILEYASKPQQKGSLGQKIGSLYNLRMDSVRLNKEGWAPIKPTLDRIAAIKDRREYQLVTAQLDFRGEGTMMYGIGVGADLRDAANNLVEVDQSGLGLGVRDYYVNDDEQTKKIRDAYKAYMKKLFQMVGNDEATAQKKMEAVMAIETRIAKASYSQVQLRDIDKNYHKMTYNQLVLDYPGIDWGNVFLASGFPAFKEICVGQPEPIHEVEKILAETSLDDLKTYAEIKVISGATSVLSDDFRAVSFELSKVMSGVQQDRPRWKRAVSTVSGVLGEAIGKIYVEKYFPESSKKRMLELVHNLQTALSQRIDEATWMSAATKAQAKDKLENFIIKIGYPDKWKDYSGLQVDDSLSLYENMANISESLSFRLCSFFFTSSDRRINKEETEKKDDSHISKSRRHRLIIHKRIDQHWQAEHIQTGSAQRKKCISLTGYQLTVNSLETEEFERQRNNGNGKKLHRYGNHIDQRDIPCQISRFQNFCLIEQDQQESYQQDKEEIGHQYSLYLFDFHFVVFCYCPNGVLFRILRPRVTSSVYTNSSPTEIPRAITESLTG